MLYKQRAGALLAALSIAAAGLAVPTTSAQETEFIGCPAKEGDPVPTPTFNVGEITEGSPSVFVNGTGWCAKPGYGGSTIVIKIDRGGYSREDESNLPDEFKGRGVWQIIQADEYGRFGDDIPLPEDISVGDHEIAFLSGSVKTNDTGELVDVHRAEFWNFTVGEHIPDPEGLDLPGYRITGAFFSEGDLRLTGVKSGSLAPGRKDNIILMPDNEKEELKVVYPSGTPGQWVAISIFYPSNTTHNIEKDGVWTETKDVVKGPNGECTGYWSKRPVKYDYSTEPIGVERGDWHKLNENHSFVVPYHLLRNIPGPAIVLVQRENPEWRDPYGELNYDSDSVVGYAWLNNHGGNNEGDIEFYPGAIDPFNPGRDRVDAIAKAYPEGSFRDLLSCGLGSTLTTGDNPSEFNRGIAYPVSPVVDASRSIVIPQTPAVEYFIDGEKVTGTVEPTGDESRTVTVVAKPSEGFRFVLPEENGSLFLDRPMEVPYEVTVPAVDVAEPAPAPSIGVLRALLADRGVSVADSAAPTDDEVAALQNAVVGVVDPAYTVTVADGAVVVARDGAEPARYALSDLFPKPEPQPEPSEQPAPTSDPTPTSEPVTPPTTQPVKDDTVNVGSFAGVGLLGALFGVLVSVLSLGGFLASNPVLVQALPQPLRDMLNHARS